MAKMAISPTLHYLPLRSATNTTVTTTHPNPCTTPTPLVHPTPPPDHARRHGRTKIQINTTINTTMAHTHWLAPRRSSDPLLGLTYPYPPRFYLSEILALRPGPLYTTAIANNTPPFPPHPSVLHPGPSYIVASIQPHKIAKTANVELRQSPGTSWMKFLFDFSFLIYYRSQ